jgi:hypothetical protein
MGTKICTEGGLPGAKPCCARSTRNWLEVLSFVGANFNILAIAGIIDIGLQDCLRYSFRHKLESRLLVCLQNFGFSIENLKILLHC